jgi:hypothetical protein
VARDQTLFFTGHCARDVALMTHLDHRIGVTTHVFGMRHACVNMGLLFLPKFDELIAQKLSVPD